MKKSIFILALLFAIPMVRAQEEGIGEILNRNVIDCYDVVNNSYALLPNYYEESKMDTVQMIIDYWKENCHFNERLQRIIILKAIDENNFSEELYDEYIIDFLLQYKGSESVYYPSFGLNPPADFQKFDKFTQDLAYRLSEQNDLGPLEKFFADFYSNHYMNEFKRLYGPEFNGTNLQAYYFEDIRKNKTFGALGYYFAAGMWAPTSSLNTLGIHPRTSFGMGYYSPNTTVMLDFGVAFLNSANYYNVMYKDSLYRTKRFSGLYLGITAEQKIIGSSRSKLNLLGGFGYEGIGTIKIYDEQCDCDGLDDIHYLNTINLNLGVGAQIYLSDYMNLFLRSKYNFLFFNNEGGTDLSGNTITVSIGAMFTGYSYERNRLRALDYNRANSW
ncbi:MAG: hypothetical protein K9G67_03100 [Bacteroidales bacterium]|nr:hypothetical protein [Bacteroidales bacterium]MCF8343960.1 hypothetical protein [Bacteroidales bacterium]MCF8351188.1 hypothetical protein [Bacteroidales bacterium]MCF8375317.1 hypothetical protein [Bacteroidales bacterium]MCF8400173.1 hypothetical protein [Bacteroidales bacterium]